MVNAFSDLIPYYSWLYIPIAVLAIVSALKYRKNCRMFASGREKALSLIFGVLFVLLYASGLVLESGATFTASSYRFILISCLLFSAAAGIGYHYVNLFLERQFSAGNNPGYLLSRHPMLFPFMTMMICWTPVLLALYPGVFAYDVAGQIPQRMGTYYVQHPLLHTFFLQAFYRLGREIGSYNNGMALSVVVQMALFALSLSYSIRYMVRRQIRKSIVIAVLIFFSIVPIFSIMAVSMTKDILFTAAFNASFIKILEMKDRGFRNMRIRDWVSVIILFSLAALLRSNGKYAVYAMLAAFLIKSLITRTSLKQTFILVITTVFLIVATDSALIAATNAAPVNKGEMLGVPYQQLARTYRYNENRFTPEDSEKVHMLLPCVGNYNPHSADGVKWMATVGNSRENEKMFWELYFRYLLKKPMRYVEAFLTNTMGYWYLDDISSAEIYGKPKAPDTPIPDGDITEPLGLFQTFTAANFGVTHESKFPALDHLIKKLFYLNQYQNLPVISVLFNMGTYFWLLALSVFYCIQKKKREAIVPIVFVLAYMATVFGGPCALFRYALPHIACIPALMAMVYKPMPASEESASAPRTGL